MVLCWQINFEDCWLESIDPASFNGLERLSALNLVNNELRTLDSAMERTLPSSLRVVRLYRNPWSCNCRLRWLRRWLVSPPTVTGSPPATAAESTINWDFARNTPTCAAPALIRGVAWRHLTADQFACPSRIVAVSVPGGSSNATAATGIRAVAGSNATVECLAAGDPVPIVSWSRGVDQVPLAPPSALISVRQTAAGDDDGEPRIVSLLTLLSVEARRDSGDYSCMAENTAGRAETTFKLVVVDAPTADQSSAGLWPVHRDAFLGTIIGLLAVAVIVVLCTVLRLRSIARRRLHNKNSVSYYVANTAANHVGHSPTSNHRPGPTDAESAAGRTDHDSRSSDERASFPEDHGKTTGRGSPKCPLLPNHHDRCCDDNARCGIKRQSEASVTLRRERSGGSDSAESRSLLSPDRGELSDSVVEEDEVHDNVNDGGSQSDDETNTNEDVDPANHQERPNRAVSFGPDMIIDAAARRRSSERDDDNIFDEDFGDKGRGQMAFQQDDEPVFQRPTVDCSPPSPPANRSSTTPNRPSPEPSVCDGPYDVVRRPGSELRLVGNGSVRGDLRQLGRRPLSPPVPTSSPFTASRPPTQSASLERSVADTTRRRLPVPVNTVQRRSPAPAVGRRQGPSSPLPGNHVPDRSPVSLAELLAPPFGHTAAAIRHLQPGRRTVKTATDSGPSAQQRQTNCIFDDDSGTDI